MLRSNAGQVPLLLLSCLVLTAPARAQSPASNAGTTFGAHEVESAVSLDNSAISSAFRHWQAGEYAQMLALVAPMADQGDALAQFLMGDFHARGLGVVQDDELAVQWWRKAAAQGMARAQNELGVALTDGRGTEQDAAQALELYRQAAEQGLAVAQANIGLLYLNGVGVRANEAQAVAWFRKAAEQELGWAQYYLAEAYLRGRGVARNPTRAIEWYRRAAEQDYAEAQYALGSMFYRGEGMGRRDNSRAAYWFARAAGNGHLPSVRPLELALESIARRRLRAAIEVRSDPDPTAPISRQMAPGELAYVLAREGEWTEVYFKDNHTLGYVRTGELGR